MFKNIKRLRKKNQLSQKELGDILGITQQQVNNIENGHSNPGYDSVLRLSEYFNVTIDYLFRDSDEEYLDSQKQDFVRYYTEADLTLRDKLFEQLSDDNKFFINEILNKLVLSQKAPL